MVRGRGRGAAEAMLSVLVMLGDHWLRSQLIAGAQPAPPLRAQDAGDNGVAGQANAPSNPTVPPARPPAGPPPLGQVNDGFAANFLECVIGGCPTTTEYAFGPGYAEFDDEIKHQFGVVQKPVPTTAERALKQFAGGREALIALGCELESDWQCGTVGSVCTLPCGQEIVSESGEHLFKGEDTVLACSRRQGRQEYTGDVKLCLRFTADIYDHNSPLTTGDPVINPNNQVDQFPTCNCTSPAGTLSALYFCEPNLAWGDNPPVCTRLGHDGSCPAIGCNYTYCRPTAAADRAAARADSGGSFWNFTIPSRPGDPIYSLPATRGPLRYLRIKRGMIGSAIMMDDSGRCNFLDPAQDYRLDSYTDENTAAYAGAALGAAGIAGYVANASFQFIDVLDSNRSNPIEFTLQLGMNTELKVGSFSPPGNNELQLRKGVQLGGDMTSPDHPYNIYATWAGLEAQGCDVSHIRARNPTRMPGMQSGCTSMPWLVRCITTGTSPYRVSGQNLPPGIAIDGTTGEFLENSAPIQTGNWTSFFTVTDFNFNTARTKALYFVVVDDQLTVNTAAGTLWSLNFPVALQNSQRRWTANITVARSSGDGGVLSMPARIPVAPNNQPGELDINALDVSRVELVICYPPSSSESDLDCAARSNIRRCIHFPGDTSAADGSVGARVNNGHYAHSAEVEGAGTTTVLIIAYDIHLQDTTDIGSLSVTAEAPNNDATGSGSGSESSSNTMIAGIAVAGFMLIFAVGGCWYLRYKRQQDKDAYSRMFFELPKNDEWEYPRAQLVRGEKLGEGAFGVVVKATASGIRGTVGPTLVAVKECQGQASIEDKINFVGESQLMKRLDHPNVLRLLGICMQEEPLLLIAEFMEFGDLKEYMRGRQTVEVSKLLSMGIDVANGLGYLNSAHRFIHRDLACRNCLLDSQLRVKIGDFGMSRVAIYKDYYRLDHQAKLPVRWMSPESLTMGSFSSASDVWSLGVVLWELFSFCEMPYPGKGNNEVFEEVRDGYQLPRPPLCPETVYAVCLQCWEHLADRRPSAFEVAMSLHEIFLKVPGADVANRTQDFLAAHGAGDAGYICDPDGSLAKNNGRPTIDNDNTYEYSVPKPGDITNLGFYSTSSVRSSAPDVGLASSTHGAAPAGSTAAAAEGEYSTVAYGDDATASSTETRFLLSTPTSTPNPPNPPNPQNTGAPVAEPRLDKEQSN